MCHSVSDVTATIHQYNVHSRAGDLVRLVCRAVQEEAQYMATLQVCTRHVGVDHTGALKLGVIDSTAPADCAAWPTLQDGAEAMAHPAMYGLLCTVFEWFRVAVDGNWTLGPYDMRRWDFLQAVAPIPFVAARDNAGRYEACPRTGFRRWKVNAMLEQLSSTYRMQPRILSVLRCALVPDATSKRQTIT